MKIEPDLKRSGQMFGVREFKAPRKSNDRVQGFSMEIEPGPVEPEPYGRYIDALVSIDSLTIQRGSGSEFEKRAKIPGHERAFPFYMRYRPYHMLSDQAQRYFDSLAHIISYASIVKLDVTDMVVWEFETIYTLECFILQMLAQDDIEERIATNNAFPLTYLLKTYERKDNKTVVIPHDDIFRIFYQKPVEREAKNSTNDRIHVRFDTVRNNEAIWVAYKKVLLDIHKTLLGMIRGVDAEAMKQAWANYDASAGLLEARILAMLAYLGFDQRLALSPNQARSFYQTTKPFHSNANIMFEELNLYLTTYVVAKYEPRRDDAKMFLAEEDKVTKDDERLLDGKLPTNEDRDEKERINLALLRREIEYINEENKEEFRQGLVPRRVEWNRKKELSSQTFAQSPASANAKAATTASASKAVSSSKSAPVASSAVFVTQSKKQAGGSAASAAGSAGASTARRR